MYLLFLPITESVSIQFSFSHGVEPFSIDIPGYFYNGQEWKRFSTKVPVLYIFVPLAMIEIVNRRWGAWQSGFMGSSPLSLPLPYNTIGLQCSKSLSEYFNTSSNGTEVVWRSGKVFVLFNTKRSNPLLQYTGSHYMLECTFFGDVDL